MLGHSKSSISRLALLAASAAILAAPAQAEEEPVNLGKITISALRTAFEDFRTGVSVTVITEEELRQSGDMQLATFLARLPGLNVVQTGPMGGRTNVTIRGADARYVAVYVDGIRVDDTSGITSQFDFGMFSTADVGGVEVLRGSQSALWGGSAVGGVINITSRQALEDGLHQSVETVAGSYGTAALRYTLSYRDDKVETAFTASKIHSDGFSSFDTVPRDKSREKDSFDATRLSFSTRYRLSDTTTLGGAIFWLDGKSDYDGFGSDSTILTQDRREIGLRAFAEYELGTSSHMFEITSYDIDRNNYSSGANIGPFRGERATLAYRGTTEVSEALTLVYGAEWMEETATNTALPMSGSTELAGIYGQTIWSPTEDLDISLSLRLDDHSTFGTQPSGRIALAYQASPDLTLRGAASTGYRAPSLYEVFGDPSNTIAPNAGLTAEESRSFEVGADYRLADGSEVGVTLFAIDTSNAITYLSCEMVDPDNYDFSCKPGTSNVYENVAGTSQRRGVELSGDFVLSDRNSLTVAYTYTDAREPSGARLLRIPFQELSLTLRSELGDRLSGNFGLHYVAGRPAEWGTPLKDYTVVNAGLNYDLNDSTSLSLRIENLFDRDYQVVPAYGTAGRSAYLGLQTKF